MLRDRLPRGAGLAAPVVLATLMLAVLAGLEQVGLSTFAIPFAATATILATAPDGPAARPRAVLLGYVVALVPALGAVALVGASITVAVVATGLAILTMSVARAVHPPAAAAATMVGMHGTGWSFLLDGALPAMAVLVALGAAGSLLGRSRTDLLRPPGRPKVTTPA
jgi:CBS-domain-containing membrane protein